MSLFPVPAFGESEGVNVLLIDNYDSFTWNLWQLIRTLGAGCDVRTHDRVSIADVERLKPDRIVISPGPGSPRDAGVSCDVIRRFAGAVPILGVCLGHQCIAEVFGSHVVHAPRVMHGKTSPVFHDGKNIFRGLPSPFDAARYHSLVAEELPADFDLLAWTGSQKKPDLIMAMAHRVYPLIGIQFHPESFLTQNGEALMRHFLFPVS